MFAVNSGLLCRIAACAVLSGTPAFARCEQKLTRKAWTSTTRLRSSRLGIPATARSRSRILARPGGTFRSGVDPGSLVGIGWPFRLASACRSPSRSARRIDAKPKSGHQRVGVGDRPVDGRPSPYDIERGQDRGGESRPLSRDGSNAPMHGVESSSFASCETICAVRQIAGTIEAHGRSPAA